MALQSTVSRSNWNLEMLVFVEGGKPEYPEKNPRSRDENQQQTQPAYDTETGNRTRSTLVGGECSHHCAIPAPIALILKENSFQLNERNYLRIHGTAMGTKMAVTFPNIFMTDIETQIVCQSIVKPSVWKRYIDDIFSLWDTCKNDITCSSAKQTHIIQQSNLRLKSQMPRLHFWKGNRFHHHSILDIKIHFKRTKTFFQYTHFPSSNPPGVKKGVVKGKALRLRRTNSSKTTFEENINKKVNHDSLLEATQII